MKGIVPESEKRKQWAEELNSLPFKRHRHEAGELVVSDATTTLSDILDQTESVLDIWSVKDGFDNIFEEEASELSKSMQKKGEVIIDALENGNRPPKRDFLQLTNFLNRFAEELTDSIENLVRKMNSGEATDVDKKWANPRDELLGHLEMMGLHGDFSGNREQAKAAYLAEARTDYETDMTTLSIANSAIEQLEEIAQELGWSAELSK